jgi:pyruvate oxidase
MAIEPLKTKKNAPPTTQTVSEVILAQLASWGVKRIYGVAGDATLSFIEAIGQQNAIQYIATRHETAAAFMASAEGKCTNRLAVCVGTSGPGLVNMLNGIADAAADHVPMLVITGQVKTSKIGTEAKQY